MKQRLLFLTLILFVAGHTYYAQNGRAINTDGINDYIDPNHLPNFNNNFTMEVWAKPTATHEIDSEMTYGIDGLYNQRFLIWPTWRGSEGGIGISMGTNGVSVYEHGSNLLPAILVYTATITGWTHVAVVIANKIPSLYINGQFIKTGITTISTNLWPSLGECNQYPGLVGGIGGGSYGSFEGDIDEVRLWNTVRTQQQIQANMYTEFNCPVGLYAYYKLNHGVASGNNSSVITATDYSGNNLNASLIGFSLSQGNISNWIAPGPVTATFSPISIAVSKTNICLGESVLLSASGGQNYSWSTGAAAASVSVTPGVTTNYTVSANLPGGCTYSAGITITVSKCTRIDEVEKYRSVKIFPNPFLASFQIEINEKAGFEIINSLGQIIQSGSLQPGQSNVSCDSYYGGVYYLKLSTHSHTSIHKIIKQ